MAEPTVIQKRAIDVTPHNHALWCSVEGLNKGELFANTIEWRGWSEDGDIVFGLDTHNGFARKPDDMMAVVEVAPSRPLGQLAAKASPGLRDSRRYPLPPLGLLPRLEHARRALEIVVVLAA
jgi:hypothetical protein